MAEAPASITDKIAEVARNNHSVVFAESHVDSHNQLLIASPQIMAALQQGGIKHFMKEGLGDTTSVVMNAYIDDKITHEQMTSYIEDNIKIGITGAFGIVFANEKDTEQHQIRLAESAKTHGMHVHSLNRGEGLFSEETMILDHERDMEIGIRIVEQMQATGSADMSEINVEQIRQDVNALPEYVGLDERIEEDVNASNQEYKARATKMYDENIDSTQDIAQEKGMSREQAIGNTQIHLWVKERVSQDYLVAKNIEELSGGEKTAVLYGAGHTYHKTGDLDHYLNEKGGAAVIALHNDKSSTFLTLPKYPGPDEIDTFPVHDTSIIEDIFGISPFEDADYEFDYKLGTWKEKGQEPEEVRDIPKLDYPDGTITFPDSVSIEQALQHDLQDGPYTVMFRNAPDTDLGQISWTSENPSLLAGVYNQMSSPDETNIERVNPFVDASAIQTQPENEAIIGAGVAKSQAFNA